MSRFSPATRGASVLAALVLAAFLASIALLVQQGSPIAYTHTQTAEVGTAISSPTDGTLEPSQQTQTEIQCQPTYDYLVDISGSKPVITPEHVCYATGKAATNGTKQYPTNPTASDWDTDGGRCVLTPNVGYQAGANWRCIIKFCKTDVSGKKCLYSYADKGASTNNEGGPADATGYTPDEKEALAAGAAAGDSDSIQQAKELLKADPSFQNTLDSAFQDQEQQLSAQYEKASQTLEDLAQLAGQCTGGGGGSACAGYQQAVAAEADAQKQLQDLTDNYASLAGSAKTLDPACGSAGNCGATPPPGTTPPGAPGSPYPDQSKPQTGFGQRPPMGGPSGGGGQQPPPQLQCQPRYFCNGNTVMYAQCYNQQPGNAQQVQQCPQGYACQNNSCQPQAQYGYCADGRTPRQGPAQQQPPASSCTVGTWQDTSNGCQTSWQCVPNGGNGGSGQPSAQLSCQPLSAISGSTVSFSYACAGGATDIAASGFSISPSTLAGNATTTIQKPAGGSSVTYSLSCTNKNVSPAATASAQCTVQVGNASIVLVATPDRVSQSETDTTKKQSTIGWVTSGMQACTIADPDFSDWTSQQAGNTSVAGAATSPVIATTTTFTLTCTTLAGTTASSSVKVLSI